MNTFVCFGWCKQHQVLREIQFVLGLLAGRFYQFCVVQAKEKTHRLGPKEPPPSSSDTALLKLSCKQKQI